MYAYTILLYVIHIQKSKAVVFTFHRQGAKGAKKTALKDRNQPQTHLARPSRNQIGI